MFNKILAPLDGSVMAECVLPHLIAWTRLTGAKPILLRVLDRSSAADQVQTVDLVDWRLRQAETEIYLGGIHQRLREAGLSAPIETALLEGEAAEQIIDYAHKHKVDLIVLSSHGRSGLSGWNISSIAQKVAVRTRASLLLIRAYRPCEQEWESFRYQRILVPLDGCQRAEAVVPLVYRLAQDPAAELLLVHVAARPDMPHRVPLTPEEAELLDNLVERNRVEMAKYLEQLKAHLPDNVQTRVIVRDNVTTALYQLVEDEQVDLVLLNAHGYSGEKTRPYGSVAASFIFYGSTPLLITQDLSEEEIELSPAELAFGQESQARPQLLYTDKRAA